MNIKEIAQNSVRISHTADVTVVQKSHHRHRADM